MRGVDVERDSVHLHRSLQRRLRRVGEGQRLVDARRARRAGRQHRVLVASQAGDQRLARRPGVGQCAQSLADLAQHRVARGMTERVVDLLEAIEVEQRHRHRPAAQALARQGTGESLKEQRAVGQPRERVIARQPIVLPRLAAQRARGAGDDAKQHRPQQRQPEEHEQRDHALVLCDRGGDRSVAEVDLKSPRRSGPPGVKRSGTYTSTSCPRPTSLAVSVVRAGGDDLGVVGPAGEGTQQVVAGRERAPDQCAGHRSR